MNLIPLLIIALTPIQAASVQQPAEKTKPASAEILTHGPFVGHLTATTANVWARCKNPGKHTCIMTEVAFNKRVEFHSIAEKTNDHCIVWKIHGLTPNREYRYEIQYGEKRCGLDERHKFKTAPKEDSDAIVKIAFGSCAREDNGTAKVWKRVATFAPDAFVLLGDTPYIDTTNLDKQRMRYRQFANVEEMKNLFRSTCMYGIWDDHDFGRNDTDGLLKGKENSRKAFIEYRSNPSYGNGKEGIYTSFRRGPIEVFLLDTRYFAATEKFNGDSNKKSLLGSEQLEWLKTALKKSTAKFKILACGMVWNEAVRPLKPDHWMSYEHERDYLFQFIGKEKITGVVLVAGDIHRSRVIKHATTDIVGYDLTEFITSPMHSSIIRLANQPHPGLIFDAGEPHSFMVATADSKKDFITFQMLNVAGKILYEEHVHTIGSRK